MAEMSAKGRLLKAIYDLYDAPHDDADVADLLQLAQLAFCDIAEREREQCCKDVCRYCNDGVEATHHRNKWMHSVPMGVSGSVRMEYCLATHIRNRSQT